jgi:hypothetical protein
MKGEYHSRADMFLVSAVFFFIPVFFAVVFDLVRGECCAAFVGLPGCSFFHSASCFARLPLNSFSRAVNFDSAVGRQLPCSCCFFPFTGSYPGQHRFLLFAISIKPMHPIQFCFLHDPSLRRNREFRTNGSPLEVAPAKLMVRRSETLCVSGTSCSGMGPLSSWRLWRSH